MHSAVNQTLVFSGGNFPSICCVILFVRVKAQLYLWDVLALRGRMQLNFSLEICHPHPPSAVRSENIHCCFRQEKRVWPAPLAGDTIPIHSSKESSLKKMERVIMTVARDIF